MTFPADYGAAHLAGKPAVFAVTVKDVKAPKPAPVDDALAERFGAENLAALTEQIKGRLAAEYAGASRAILKRRLMDALDGVLSFDLPPSLVKVEAAQIAHQLWHDEHKDHHGHDHPEIEPTEEHARLAERRVRLGLLLADVGNKNDITVSDQEMQRAVIAQARQYPGQERQFVEFIQKNAQAVQQLRAPIFEEKVVDYVLELAEVTEKPVSKDELEEGDRGARGRSAGLGCRRAGRAVTPDGCGARWSENLEIGLADRTGASAPTGPSRRKPKRG